MWSGQAAPRSATKLALHDVGLQVEKVQGPRLDPLAEDVIEEPPQGAPRDRPPAESGDDVEDDRSQPRDGESDVLADELTEAEGWRVIVENRPGGVTTIAATDVLTQPADGHSLYAMSVPSVAAPSLVPNISFNLDKDFDPVIKATVSYNVLVVNPSVQAKTVADLVALLKSQPDKLTFSSGGFGTPAHLIGEQFKLQTGTRAQHVPYAQFPQAIGDLLNGTNAFMFITMLPVVDLIKTGKLRALAVTGPNACHSFPMCRPSSKPAILH